MTIESTMLSTSCETSGPSDSGKIRSDYAAYAVLECSYRSSAEKVKCKSWITTTLVVREVLANESECRSVPKKANEYDA